MPDLQNRPCARREFSRPASSRWDLLSWIFCSSLKLPISPCILVGHPHELRPLCLLCSTKLPSCTSAGCAILSKPCSHLSPPLFALYLVITRVLKLWIQERAAEASPTCLTIPVSPDMNLRQNTTLIHLQLLPVPPAVCRERTSKTQNITTDISQPPSPVTPLLPCPPLPRRPSSRTPRRPPPPGKRTTLLLPAHQRHHRPSPPRPRTPSLPSSSSSNNTPPPPNSSNSPPRPDSNTPSPPRKPRSPRTSAPSRIPRNRNSTTPPLQPTPNRPNSSSNNPNNNSTKTRKKKNPTRRKNPNSKTPPQASSPAPRLPASSPASPP